MDNIDWGLSKRFTDTKTLRSNDSNGKQALDTRHKLCKMMKDKHSLFDSKMAFPLSVSNSKKCASHTKTHTRSNCL